MLHTVLIVQHAAAGVAAFAAGLLCLPLRVAGSWRFRIYAGSLVAMLVFVLGAIAVAWADLSLASRLVFTGLTALGLYMLWRAGRARANLERRDHGWRPRYLDDVGFTLISLFAGFVVVAAIDLHLPSWLVALIAAGGVAAGIYTMKQVKTRLVTRQLGGQAAEARRGPPAGADSALTALPGRDRRTNHMVVKVRGFTARGQEMAAGVQVRRVYHEPEPGDGTRVLVDRIWPRGLTRARAALDEWCKDVAPSDDLSAWYGHDPDRFAEFGRRYQVELRDPRRAEALAHLRELAAENRLTLLTATRRADLSAAVVLAALLQDRPGGGHAAMPAAAGGRGAEAGPPVTLDPAPATDIVHECGLGSFPASDPPSWWAHAGTR